MFGICLRYATDHYQAEDILQEGFVKIFMKMSSYRNEGSFEGWMKRIFVNTAIEHIRKQIPPNIWVEEDKAPQVPSHESVTGSLNAKDLMRMVQALPTGYRTVFNLYAIEGYNHREIATMLGITEGTSKSQLARARFILQKLVNNITETATAGIAGFQI
jgi:RNA polymerase sigma-70 factor (ECF subfamily)